MSPTSWLRKSTSSPLTTPASRYVPNAASDPPILLPTVICRTISQRNLSDVIADESGQTGSPRRRRSALPCGGRLKHVLILGMDYGLVLFTSDRGIAPAPRPSSPTTTALPPSTCPNTPTSRSSGRPRTRPPATSRCPTTATCGRWIRGCRLGAACAVTSRVRLSTAVALPVEHDPITLAKSIATFDHLSGGRVSARRRIRLEHRRTRRPQRAAGAAAHHASGVPGSDAGAVDAGGSVVRRRVRQLRPVAGRGPSRCNRTSRCWSARRAPRRTSSGSRARADGWITTPRDFDIDAPVKLLQDTWAAAGRDGAPQIVALDFKPDPDKLARWAELGVTEVLFGLPDKSEADVAAYVERLAGKLAALV